LDLALERKLAIVLFERVVAIGLDEKLIARTKRALIAGESVKCGPIAAPIAAWGQRSDSSKIHGLNLKRHNCRIVGCAVSYSDAITVKSEQMVAVGQSN
jgi:hypothetical protein